MQVHCKAEVQEFIQHADALVINIGTLETGRIEGMKVAAQAATVARKKWILDPVGVGAPPSASSVHGWRAIGTLP